jgi:hypothetical protein
VTSKVSTSCRPHIFVTSKVSSQLQSTCRLTIQDCTQHSFCLTTVVCLSLLAATLRSVLLVGRPS